MTTQPTYLLHSIGPRINSNFNTREEIQKLHIDALLTFDGVYESVKLNADILEGRNVILFPMGMYVGHTNEFDNPASRGEPLQRYLTWPEIFALRERIGPRCRIGYHSWSHRSFNTIAWFDIRQEIHPPHESITVFAYPYGDLGASHIDIKHLLSASGYTEAYSVSQGDGSQFQKKRQYLNW